MIVIVDYGMGNLKSIFNAFKALDVQVSVSSDPSELQKARAIVLPGVGAFGDGMRKLHDLGMVDLLSDRVLEHKVPYLGVCLGMQFLAGKSHEHGEHAGFGWIPGEVVRIKPAEPIYKVPHMGWNEVRNVGNSPLLYGLKDRTDFYFVHSYHFQPEPGAERCVTGVANHGGHLAAMVEKDNIFGVQFHPEKSQGAGLALLANFIRHVGNHA